MREARTKQGPLGVARGAAFYVGALVGPGVLIVPSLAAQAAGPASVAAWAALLMLSVPLAATFSVLGRRHPVPGGVAQYVLEGFGADASAVTGIWFLTAVVLGAPAVSLVGGYYVADITGGGTSVAVAVGLAMFAAVLTANLLGLRISSGFQLGLAAVLVVMIAVAVSAALPGRTSQGWHPFAPHGWWAVGTAANILIWLFIGWEAMAQLAGEFADPDRDLPRSVAVAFSVMAVLYSGLAVATVVVRGTAGAKVPLADLVAAGFGRGGRDATAVLAVALTVGTMNVYVGSAAKLAGSLAEQHALPAWFAAGEHRDIPRRPLLLFACTGAVLLGGLAAGLGTTSDLVRSTSACFIAVYILALGSAARILDGRGRAMALVALVPVLVLAVFSAAFLMAPAVAAIIAVGLRRVTNNPGKAAEADAGLPWRAHEGLGQPDE